LFLIHSFKSAQHFSQFTHVYQLVALQRLMEISDSPLKMAQAAPIALVFSLLRIA